VKPVDRKEEKKIKVECPCCEAKLLIDSRTGEVLWHEIKEKHKESHSLGEMIKKLDVHRKETEERFERERQALKERPRILEEKVKEAMKRVDKDGPPPVRPIDLD
jgi:flagellar basal body P-ring protein FlgI